jgi:hypothetical protein
MIDGAAMVADLASLLCVGAAPIAAEVKRRPGCCDADLEPDPGVGGHSFGWQTRAASASPKRFAAERLR